MPKEYANLLTYLKIAGIDLEIESDFYKLFINLHLKNDNTKALNETRKALFSLYYPDSKDASETLMEEMQRRIVDDPKKTIKMGIKSDKKLDPVLANRLLNKV